MNKIKSQYIYGNRALARQNGAVRVSVNEILFRIQTKQSLKEDVTLFWNSYNISERAEASFCLDSLILSDQAERMKR